MTSPTYAELRGKLPGYQNKEVILSHTSKNGQTKKLLHVTVIVGFFDDLYLNSNLRVTYQHANGFDVTTTFDLSQLTEAVKYYTDIPF